MKVNRFVAPTSREALIQVREALGDDAVILSNRDTAEGVEILASSENILNSSIAVTNAKPSDSGSKVSNPTPQTNTSELELAKVMSEIRAMRGSLEAQLNALGSHEQPKNPIKSAVFRELLAIGFSSNLCRYLVKHIPQHLTEEQALNWAKAALIHNLKTLEDENEVLGKGGIFALVGPTGVGKTTTTAKLAARFVLRHGANKLALINTDSYRIGAPEQVRIYGKILGVSVYSVRDEADLKNTLESLKDKHCVLIDTVGMSQRDLNIAEQIAMLSREGQAINRLLCLNTTSSIETLNEVIETHSGAGLTGCILTKLDEAVNISNALDVVLRHKLKIFYTAVGQRVPEDLELADAKQLVETAYLRRQSKSASRLKDDELALIMDDNFDDDSLGL
jgi:flagellar biosynthesis protein FlhF